jgi:hypothetical protein
MVIQAVLALRIGVFLFFCTYFLTLYRRPKWWWP